MKNPLSKIARQNGFIAIVALGIVSLMTVFLVILVATTNTSYKNLKTTKDYYIAQDVANSILESLELMVAEKDFGYNFEQTCGPADFGITEGATANTTCSTGTTDGKDICTKLGPSLKSQGIKDITVKLKISGRPQTSTELSEQKSLCPNEVQTKNFFTGTSTISSTNPTYIVPFPGRGAAGNNCNLYLEEFTKNANGNFVGSKINNKWQIGTEGISQLDYSCNWGKLSLGSSSTDRVAIPLYYTASDGTIVNPFNSQTQNNKATKFIVRLRTPCIKTDLKPGEEEKCERYKLNESDGNDIIVQWQLTGTCPVGANGKEEECGLVQAPDSAEYLLNESMINGNNKNTAFKNYMVLGNIISGSTVPIVTPGEDLNNLQILAIDQMLVKIKRPVFSLFLNKKLLSTAKTKIPYLEYQVITDQPIGDAETKMEVQITVNGTQLNKTIYKKNKKDLIDFAIQN